MCIIIVNDYHRHQNTEICEVTFDENRVSLSSNKGILYEENAI